MNWRIHSIRVNGLRCLEDVTLDLTEGTSGRPRDFALILGENGCGKSNLLDSVAFLKMTLDTALLQEASGMGAGGPDVNYGEIDAEHERTHEFRVPFDVPEVPVWDIRSVADRFRTADSPSGPEVEMSFSADGSRGSYMIRLGYDGRVEEESLDFRIGSNTGNVFHIVRNGDAVESRYSGALFPRAALRRRFEGIIGSMWGEHSALALIHAENIRDGGETAGQLGTGIMDVIGFLGEIVVMTGETRNIVSDGMDPVLRNMMVGTLDEADEHLLDRYGTFLDYILFDLSSEVERAYYRRERVNGRIEYELRVERKMGGRSVDIPASSESKGIQRLVSLFSAIYLSFIGRVVLLDDLDENLNVCLLPGLVEGGRRGSEGQLIATTHCTLLLEDTEPQNCYVIQVDMDGCRRIASFPRIARTMSNHNNRLRYESGAFGGIPCPGYIDLQSISQIANGEGASR